MRRLFANSTAIAVALALSAPHAALAETAAPADGTVLLPPGAAAPADAAKAAADEAAAAAEAAADKAADAAAKAEDKAAEAVAKAEEKAAAVEAPAASAEVKAAEKAADDAAAKAEAAAKAADAKADAAVTSAPPASSPATPPVASPAPVTATPVLVTEPAAPKASEAPAAAPVDKAGTVAPAETPETKDSVAPSEKPAAAADPVPAPVPAPATVPAPAAAPADTAAATPSPVPVPEAVAPVTDVAKAAAEAAPAPAAAALAADAQPAAPAVETKVTTENSRASTQDFQTSLATAAAPQAERKDDRKDDLAKMALAGLAGFAVGKMLSDNRQVVLNSGDRAVVTLPDGSQQLVKDDNALLFRPGSTVQTENFADGSSRTTVLREDGSKVVTIRDAEMRVLRRTLMTTDGRAVALIDDTAAPAPVKVSTLPPPARPVVFAPGTEITEKQLREALRQEAAVDRRFTLGQIRAIPEVRALVAPVDVSAITFDTGSAAIKPDQARKLSALGQAIAASIADNPREIFMIEGYTDTVGSEAANLALSDRRAESVALALTEYFQVPPENMVVQGYGEQFLRVQAEGDIRENRRAAVRRITDLLDQPKS